MLRRQLCGGTRTSIVSLRCGGDGSSSSEVVHGDALIGSSSSSIINRHSPLAIQRRFSLRYASKMQMPEISQPTWLHDKRFGMFSYERHIGRARRNWRRVESRFTTHMNLWSTDLSSDSNRMMTPYYGLQKDLHKLLGRPHYLETNNRDHSDGLSAYEMNTDMRFKGVERSAMTNSYYEPEWNHVLYSQGSNGAALNDPNGEETQYILGEELMRIRDSKNKEHCTAWWERLKYLINVHHAAVGDLGDFKSRNIQHVHRFFVAFHEAISSFEFQDRYLKEHLVACRPQGMEDVFGMFIEMEANYVNHDYCPRCSLPFATTRYCGEGDPQTPFRKHRGRWAPHQQWGKEWDEVVCRRAEALWYRATEDELFGSSHHTQRQTEALMNVYLKTRQRGKAIAFMTNLRGSKEFIRGLISITPTLQAAYDRLLDTTPHPHLITNGFKTDAGSQVYLGEVHKVPFSPQQFRLDMEMSKFRRMQKEEGVVRLPPKDWKIDLSSIVPYKVQDKQVVNWRAVKEGIEKSFMATGLRPEAYTQDEWREIHYLTDLMATLPQRSEQIEKECAASQAKLGANGFVFPDELGYRCFDISDAAFKVFSSKSSVTLSHGMRLQAAQLHFWQPQQVAVITPSKRQLEFDATDATLKQFGVRHGEVVRLSPKTNKAASAQSLALEEDIEVVILGVDVGSGSSSNRQLLGAATSDLENVMELGTDILDVRSKFGVVRHRGFMEIPYLDGTRTCREEFQGTLVGVLNGLLYAQWGQNVATPIGTPDQVAKWWRLYPDSGAGKKTPQEPFSWATPFRNNWVQERIEELRQAPWKREQWISIIPGKYTPKTKRFGYTQHITQDDFVTKEYKDRLVSKQFFTSPNSFEIVPDETGKGARFGSKQEFLRLQGLPTVDRNELENGWAEVTVMHDREMKEVEQCIRDIGGDRPGNFVKSPTETSSLKLNESWWSTLEYGWEQHNREQNLLDSSEKKLIDSSKLPFHGRLPAFGTTYGVAERIREVAEDFGKGFGLGPHQLSPGADKGSFNTLGAEQSRVAALGFGNLLVRMFNEKLGIDDIHSWVIAQCSSSLTGNINAKKLLLSLHEWRDCGRPPSALLISVLSTYLKDEIAAYNSGIPAGAETLSLDLHPAVLAPTKDNIWASTDKTEYALDALREGQTSADFGASSSDMSLVVSAVVRSQLQSVRSTDEMFMSQMQADTISNFQSHLAALANRGVTVERLLEVRNRSVNPNAAMSHLSMNKAVPCITLSALTSLLQRFGLSQEERNTLVSRLASHPDCDRGQDVNTHLIPLQTVMTWRGEATGSIAAVHGGAPKTGGTAVASAFGSGSAGNRSGSGSDPRSLSTVLEQLTTLHDGLAMDVNYIVRELRGNDRLRLAFAFTVQDVVPAAEVDAKYEAYITGKYVPNAKEAVTMFVSFLQRASADPKLMTRFFKLDEQQNNTIVGIIPADPSLRDAFYFENVRSEVRKTYEQFNQSNIPTGDTQLFFADSGSLSYRVGPSQPQWESWDQSVPALQQAVQQWYASATKSSGSNSNSALFRFDRLAKEQILLGACYRDFFLRTLPVLNYYRSVVLKYLDALPSLQTEATQSVHALSNIIQNERNTTVDRDFRMNAERYWRGVLDGRGLEDLGSRGGSGGNVFGKGGLQSARHSTQGVGSGRTGPSASSSSSARTDGGNRRPYGNRGGQQQGQADAKGSINALFGSKPRTGSGGSGAGAGAGGLSRGAEGLPKPQQK